MLAGRGASIFPGKINSSAISQLGRKEACSILEISAFSSDLNVFNTFSMWSESPGDGNLDNKCFGILFSPFGMTSRIDAFNSLPSILSIVSGYGASITMLRLVAQSSLRLFKIFGSAATLMATSSSELPSLTCRVSNEEGRNAKSEGPYSQESLRWTRFGGKTEKSFS